MRRTTWLVAGLLLLAGCGGTDPVPVPEPTASPVPPATTAPSGGTSDAPAPVAETTDLLPWQPVPGPTSDTVTTNGSWTLTYDERPGTATLAGPIAVAPDTDKGPVSDALLSDEYAIVVHQDRQEREPAVAVVTDLATGAVTTIDGSTPGAPTVNGGTWALDGDRAVHATNAPGGEYCLADVDLRTLASSVGYCVGPREGFSAAHLSSDGDTLLTFDDQQPSCRTVVSLDGATATAFAGVEPCKGFEGVSMPGGSVWSVVPKENRIEAAVHYARVGDDVFDLGAGSARTLVRCGAAAYFVRDPQTDTDPARLMRWDGATLAVVYESKPGRSFLSSPRCAGSVLTVSSFAESGDEQVSAPVS